jgi:nucleoside-diphosphate-sugar epimerase
VRVLVTGSSGHLGEALVRVLRERGDDVVGLDVLESPFTDIVGSVADRELVGRVVSGVEAILHAATLHKPHVGSHSRGEFIETNVAGTLTLLEEAVNVGVSRFVFTSTTSAFGRALTPAPDAPTAWVTEDVTPLPRNIYGVSKRAAEDLCELAWRDYRLPCLILRTSRFFPEPDDSESTRATYDDLNLKVNELLYRRVDLEDVVDAHLLALERAEEIGFGRYLISATTPFRRDQVDLLRRDLPSLVADLFLDYEEIYRARGWRMLPGLDRVYDNALAVRELGFAPRYDFRHALDRLAAGQDPRSPLARQVGAKGYHAETTGIYTTR